MFAAYSKSLIFARLSFSSRVRFLLDIFLILHCCFYFTPHRRITQDLGWAQKIIDQDSAIVVNFISTHIINFSCHIVFLLFYLFLMCKTSLILTFVTLAVYPIMYIAVIHTGKQFNAIKNDLWNINANNTFLFEIIGKWKEVKSNRLETSIINQYQQRLVPEKKTNLRWMLCFSINSMMYAIKNELYQKILVYFWGLPYFK